MILYDVGPVEIVLLQGSPFCNIDCQYCYLPDRASTKRMTMETLRAAYRFLFRDPSLLSSRLRLVWHAGEPLALPLSFHQAALDLQRELCPTGINIQNMIQTNGTLLTDEWVHFIQRNNITVGVSIDGPAEFHDAQRITRAGSGTFSKVVEGITKLATADVPFGTLTVLTDRSLDHAQTLWDLYSALGVREVGFLIESLLGVHLTRKLDRDTLQLRLEAFFEKIWDYRAAQGPGVSIRELDDNEAKLSQGGVPYKECERKPLSIITISAVGDVSTFSPDLLGAKHLTYGDFIFGNVNTSTIHDIVKQPNFKAVYRDILKGCDKCRQECEHFIWCGGGLPSAKLYENGSFDSTETPSCQMRIKAPINLLRRIHSA